MRTISNALQSVYDAANNARSVFVIVEVHDGTSWFDLSDSYGNDWIESVSYGFHIDEPVGNAEIVLRRQHFNDSLCPFLTGSRFNAVGTLMIPGREMRIKTATMPMDTAPAASDYVTVFQGYLDQVGVDDSVTIRCRDYGGVLQDRFIEDSQDYGDDSGGTTVESLMQDILDDVDSKASFPFTINLYSVNGDDTSLPGSAFNASDSPGWGIRRYEQKRQPVLEALTVLSTQIGYDLRYRWHENAAAFRFVLSEPSRTSPSVDHTFGSDEYKATSIEHSRESVRNLVRVGYSNLGERPDFVTVSDSGSITKYGRRFMEIAEGSASQIDSSTEATSLANAALNDLKEPTVHVSAEVPYFYVAELGDYYTLTADNVFFDTNQSLGLQGVQHEISRGVGKSVLALAGKPASGKAGWIGRQRFTSNVKIGVRNVLIVGDGERSNQLSNGTLSQYSAG